MNFFMLTIVKKANHIQSVKTHVLGVQKKNLIQTVDQIHLVLLIICLTLPYMNIHAKLRPHEYLCQKNPLMLIHTKE